MSRKYFGTDGIRGLVGEYPITPEFVMKLGWAAGKVFARNGEKKILIGKDTRLSGYMFEAALEAGLTAAGVKPVMLGVMPTPGIAYLTRAFRADAGIVISASHNPYYDNGIKFFSSEGTKLPDSVEAEIEAMLDQEMVCVAPDKMGRASRVNDAVGRYIEFCKSTIPSQTKLNGLRIVVDSANGATYKIGASVFEELGAEVIAIGVEPNGTNINEGCGSTHVDQLKAAVLHYRADFGVAFDGDGDRVLMVDGEGGLLDGDDILYIIANDLHQTGCLKGGVAGTLMTNLGLELAFKKMGIPFVRTNVGDRYVMEALVQNNWQLGGETSGHTLCLYANSTGDGVVTSLQVINAIIESGKSVKKLAAGWTKCPQDMVNVRVTDKKAVEENEVIQSAVAQATKELEGRGRVLLRPSGTEPVVRVMVEAENDQLVEKYVNYLVKVVKENLGEK